MIPSASGVPDGERARADAWLLDVRERALGVRKLAEYAARELRSRPPFGIAERFRLWRHGFTSFSGLLYGVDEATSGRYLSDYERATQGFRVNGGFSSLIENKLAFSYLVEAVRPGTVAPLVGIVRDGDATFVDAPHDAVRSPHVLAERLAGSVLKPVEGALGRGVVVVLRGDDGGLVVNGSPATADEVARAVGRLRAHVITAHVRQAAYARAIHAPTTNTIRVVTMRDPDSGEVFVPLAVHRFGSVRSGAIDTWHGGGVCAAVEVASGALGQAVAEPKGRELTWCAHHPDSGAPIEGVEVTGWAEVVAGLTDLAGRLPFLPYVGWDVVVTDAGFRVIEGNNRSDVDFLQVHRPLLADPRVRRFFEHHGVLRSSRRRGPRRADGA